MVNFTLRIFYHHKQSNTEPPNTTIMEQLSIYQILLNQFKLLLSPLPLHPQIHKYQGCLLLKWKESASWTPYSQCPESLHFSLGFPLDKSSLSGHSWDSKKRHSVHFNRLPKKGQGKIGWKTRFRISHLYLKPQRILHHTSLYYFFPRLWQGTYFSWPFEFYADEQYHTNRIVVPHLQD